MTYVLWTLQALLAALFLFAGAVKLVTPIEMLTDMIPLPGLLIRFVGLAEFLGGLGLILPSLLRIRPGLVVLAAVELAHLMVGAAIITLVTADLISALMPIVVGCLAAFVAVGRWRQVLRTPATRRVAALHPAAWLRRIPMPVMMDPGGHR